MSRQADWSSQPRVTAGQMTDDLRALGLQNGSVVLVHSSLSRIGNVDGGAEAVIDALCDVVGPHGTLLFPTLTGSSEDGPEHPPIVDLRTTPCWTGCIPETARRRSAARRSIHPTHSIAALGARSEKFSAGHERSTSPCDERSPYYRLIAEGGYILLIGTTQESNTTLHCLEELARVPYHLQQRPTDGIVVDMHGRQHVVTNYLHDWGTERDFARIDLPLREKEAMCIGKVGQAEARLIDAIRMADEVLTWLRSDPLHLVKS
jgi:aminoglycoside 3-N-acetyltransferase